jgi:threonine dehydrogenase-like Zn-dependent dehydrogenase
MRGTVSHATRDVRFQERPDPVIVEPTDAVIRTVAACVCGSDLWRYRGIQEVAAAVPMGQEHVGIVEQIGAAVTTVAVGDFVAGGFLHSDNTCAVCAKGVHANCLHVVGFDGCQAEKIRIPAADGTLLRTAGQPDADLIPACWPSPTSCAPDGTPRSAPTSSRARASSSSATARSASAASSPPNSSAPRPSSP